MVKLVNNGGVRCPDFLKIPHSPDFIKWTLPNWAKSEIETDNDKNN